MRSPGRWLTTLLCCLALYCLSLGPVAVAAFRFDRQYGLGKLWGFYRIYVEPVCVAPWPLNELATDYMQLWCRFTKTTWPGDYTLD
jgi:hypothetical protein